MTGFQKNITQEYRATYSSISEKTADNQDLYMVERIHGHHAIIHHSIWQLMIKENYKLTSWLIINEHLHCQNRLLHW